MERFYAIVMLLSLLLVCPGTASTEDIVETVAKGCQTEIETFCSQVTPGEGRVLACLYAHNDKLSSQCEWALYDAAAQLERYINALTYVANECEQDLETLCSAVEAGEGRLLNCLKDNEAQLADRCKQALSDVGLEE